MGKGSAPDEVENAGREHQPCQADHAPLQNRDPDVGRLQFLEEQSERQDATGGKDTYHPTDVIGRESVLSLPVFVLVAIVVLFVLVLVLGAASFGFGAARRTA